jgi:hypothetical protein
MTKKPQMDETDPIQSERFRQAVRDLEDAGGLNPIGEEALDELLRQQAEKEHSPLPT